MLHSKKDVGSIQVFTHGFKVMAHDPRIKLACRRVLSDWVVRTDKKVENARGEMVTVSVPTQIYGAELNNGESFWFHKGQFPGLQTELRANQLMAEDLSVEYIKTHKPDKVKLELRKGRVLRDYQEDARRFALDDIDVGDHFSKLIAMPTGTGKFQRNDTPVLTPDGWKEIGSLVPGDLVISVDGTATKVKAVYPQGVQPLYRITFSDGRQTNAGPDHLWKVHNNDWRGDGWRVKDTLEIKKYIEIKKSKVRVPLYTPQEGMKQDLPIDPYLLGALLGDGTLRDKGQIGFTKADDHFEEVFRDKLPEGNMFTRDGIEWKFGLTEEGIRNRDFTLKPMLKNLGLTGLLSHQKFIPDLYMKGSFSQRLELIRGLMDTDGTSEIKGACSFSTTSKVLAEQFVELIRSLGGMAKIGTRTPKYPYNGEMREGRIAYNISIRHKNPAELFTLKRKKERVEYKNQYSETLALAIDDITFIGMDECTCIEVEHPSHLYVCNDYIVTHNTVTFCGIVEKNSERVLISVLPKYHVKWVGDKNVIGDLESNLDVKKSDIMPVETKGQLRGLIHICKEQGSKKLPKIIAITLTVMRGFIEDYEKDPDGCLQDYGAVPWQLAALTGVGIVGVDEAHEHIYSVFKLAMYLHGVKFISLSGTMRTEDAFQEKVQNVIFPKIKRYEEVKMEKYIDVEFIGYHFARDLLHKIRYQAFGRNDYSHAVLEKSILRYPRLLNGYIKIVTGILDWDFVKVRRPEEKAIVYVATVDMADKFITALTVRYPHLKIARYCAAQGDKYADLMSSDITVSTIQSSGTAVDIPNLICNICTTMVNSSKSNLQVLGRLRKLPGGRKVTLYMPFCRDIKKHFKYTEFRFELFKDITKSIKTFNYGNRVGDDF